MLSYGCIRPQ